MARCDARECDGRIKFRLAIGSANIELCESCASKLNSSSEYLNERKYYDGTVASYEYHRRLRVKDQIDQRFEAIQAATFLLLHAEQRLICTVFDVVNRRRQ